MKDIQFRWNQLWLVLAFMDRTKTYLPKDDVIIDDIFIIKGDLCVQLEIAPHRYPI